MNQTVFPTHPSSFRLPKEPYFRHLAAAAGAASARWALPGQVQLAIHDRLGRNSEFQDLILLVDIGVNFQLRASLEADRTIAVDHAQTVTCSNLQARVVHAQGRIVEGQAMIPP